MIDQKIVKSSQSWEGSHAFRSAAGQLNGAVAARADPSQDQPCYLRITEHHVAELHLHLGENDI